MGAGVPSPCSANRVNESRSIGVPSAINAAPATRNQVSPRKGGCRCQREIHQGASPATHPGANPKNKTDPRIAHSRLIGTVLPPSLIPFPAPDNPTRDHPRTGIYKVAGMLYYLTKATIYLLLSDTLESRSNGRPADDTNRAEHRRSSRLQPLLHPANRRAARRSSPECVFAHRRPRSVRDRSPAAAHRHRTPPGTRTRSGISQPPTEQTRKARLGREVGIAVRWPPKPAPADGAGQKNIRHPRRPPKRGGRSPIASGSAHRTIPAGAGDAIHRDSARCPSCSHSLHFAIPSTRRHGLGGAPPRRSLRPGVWVRRAIRSPGG